MLVLRKEDHSMDERERRFLAVGAYLAGAAPTEVARTVGRTVRWLLKWARRYREGRPDWAQDRSRAPHRMPGRSPTWVERLIVRVRRTLMTRPRVQHGAQAIRQVLAERGVTPLPRVGLINRVLTRHGLVSRRQRRFTPKGLPYPAIVPTGALCHALDPVGPRYLEGDGRFFSLHTMLVNSREVALEPHRHLTDPILLEALWKTWQRLGLPDYAQMDNKPPFTPSPRNPYRLSQVLRLLLTCGIEPIFIALAEPWRNGHVERFNRTADQRFFRAQRLRRWCAAIPPLDPCPCWSPACRRGGFMWCAWSAPTSGWTCSGSASGSAWRSCTATSMPPSQPPNTVCASLPMDAWSKNRPGPWSERCPRIFTLPPKQVNDVP
ncbi:MAG: hypothetical protein HW376_1310, partial [candidate division NC10 bacterium]|nr:hypothetical protein [candidate division NC10 bacterium]